MNGKRIIAVLMGGTSNEREISLISGKNVADALEATDQYEVHRVILDKDELPNLVGIEACYIALHGGWGENGGVQSALDKLQIPYTGPGAKACQMTMDKIATKRMLDAANVPTASWSVISEKTVSNFNFEAVGNFPLVVKAPRDGSSVGVYLVNSKNEFYNAVKNACEIDRAKFGGEGEALVEAYIPGRETTVGVLGETVLPVVEINAPGGWYGYEEKYNSNDTRYTFPNDDFLPEMQRQALAAFKATCCRGITRVDFRITPEGKMYVLELNTSPGMTEHSLIPKAARQIGIEMPELCSMVLEGAAHD